MEHGANIVGRVDNSTLANSQRLFATEGRQADSPKKVNLKKNVALTVNFSLSEEISKLDSTQYLI